MPERPLPAVQSSLVEQRRIRPMSSHLCNVIQRRDPLMVRAMPVSHAPPRVGSLKAVHWIISFHTTIRYEGGNRGVLVVWEGVSADPAVEDTGWIGILCDRAKVEYPEVHAVAVLQETLGILASVAVQCFQPRRRVSHHYDLVRNVDKICICQPNVPLIAAA